LGIFPFQGKSHFIVASALLQQLANRGHDVTVISHLPPTEKIANYTEFRVMTTVMDVMKGQGETLCEINKVRYEHRLVTYIYIYIYIFEY
jgi:nucleoside-diphosphate-sugar epimerase